MRQQVCYLDKRRAIASAPLLTYNFCSYRSVEWKRDPYHKPLGSRDSPQLCISIQVSMLLFNQPFEFLLIANTISLGFSWLLGSSFKPLYHVSAIQRLSIFWGSATKSAWLEISQDLTNQGLTEGTRIRKFFLNCCINSFFQLLKNLYIGRIKISFTAHFMARCYTDNRLKNTFVNGDHTVIIAQSPSLPPSQRKKMRRECELCKRGVPHIDVEG